MTYLGGSLAAMTADRNLWHTRADQAWGRNRAWNNGASWETEYGQSQAALASMTAERDSWYTNYNNAIASRDYWQHTVAHNDADVWNTRYNAGYAQGDADQSPAPLTTQDTTISVGSVTGNQAMATFTATRTGYYHLSGWLACNSSNWSNQWRADIYVNGAAVVNGPSRYLDGVAGHVRGVQWRGIVSAGQSMQLYSILLGGTAPPLTVTGEFYTTFIPTPTYTK